MPDLFNAKKTNKTSVKNLDHRKKIVNMKLRKQVSKKQATKNKDNDLPEILDNIKKNKVAKKSGALQYPETEAAAEKLPGHTRNPLASYIYFPTSANFVNRDPQEKIVLILRRHPVTNLNWMAISFFLIMTPAFFTVLPIFESMPVTYKIFSFMAWYLLVFAYMFEKFLNWFFSVNIVTDERIFDVDFYNLIYRKMTDANIDEIQDVTVRMGGGISTMFNFGDVFVQTASETPEIEFEGVPYPDRIAKVLRELRIEEEIEKLEGRVR
jgi:hypothetical protein